MGPEGSGVHFLSGGPGRKKREGNKRTQKRNSTPSRLGIGGLTKVLQVPLLGGEGGGKT